MDFMDDMDFRPAVVHGVHGVHFSTRGRFWYDERGLKGTKTRSLPDGAQICIGS